MSALGRLRRISIAFCVVSAGFAQTLSFNRTDISLGSDVQDDPLHRSDEMVVNSEVSSQGNNRPVRQDSLAI